MSVSGVCHVLCRGGMEKAVVDISILWGHWNLFSFLLRKQIMTFALFLQQPMGNRAFCPAEVSKV